MTKIKNSLAVSQSTLTWRLVNLLSADCVTPWNGSQTLSSGMTNEEILADYEDLETADIQAVLFYAARLARLSG